MWDLIVTFFEALAAYDEARRKGEFHARREDIYLRDWIIRKRLNIPPVAEDIT